MKKFLLLICLVLIPAIAFCQNTKPNTQHIKKMTITESKYEKGQEKSKFKDMEVMYDVRGNVIEEVEYQEGKIISHFQYRYDAANNKIMEIEMEAGKIKKITEYKYNSNNQRTEKVVYDAAKNLKSKKTYLYESY